MRDFFASLGSLNWWLSVVVVGFLIHITSAYLKSIVDFSLSRISTKWRLRSEAGRAKRQKHIEKLRGDLSEQILIATSEVRNRIGALTSLLLSAILYAWAIFISIMPADNPLWRPLSPSTVLTVNKFGKPVSMYFASVGMLMTFGYIFKAFYYHRLLIDAYTEPAAEPDKDADKST